MSLLCTRMYLYIVINYITRKTVLPQDKILDLVTLVLTTAWYTINSRFFQQTHDFAMGGPAPSTTAKMYLQAHEQIATSTTLHLPKVQQRFADEISFLNILT